MPEIQKRSEIENAAALYQDSQQNVASKDIEVNGGLNLAEKRAKPNNAGPVLVSAISSEPKGARKRTKNQRVKRRENKKLQRQ